MYIPFQAHNVILKDGTICPVIAMRVDSSRNNANLKSEKRHNEGKFVAPVEYDPNDQDDDDDENEEKPEEDNEIVEIHVLVLNHKIPAYELYHISKVAPHCEIPNNP